MCFGAHVKVIFMIGPLSNVWMVQCLKGWRVSRRMQRSGGQGLCVVLLKKTLNTSLYPLFHTPNANMADHSVIARDELHESEASEASVFCFDNASPENLASLKVPG